MQEKLDRQIGKYRSDKRITFDYYCSSIVHCPDCGKPLVGISGKGKTGQKYVYYAHKGAASGCRLHGLNAEDLHACIRSRIRKLAQDPAFIEELYQTAEANEKALKPDSEKTVQFLREQAKEKRTQIENLLASLENGNPQSESMFLQRRIKERETELIQLESRIENPQSDASFARDNLVNATELFELVRKLDKHFHKLSAPASASHELETSSD